MSWSTPPTRRSYACRGDFLKSLREKRGWTQEEFAAIVGYSPRLIRKAEGSASLNPESIHDLAEALSTTAVPVYPEDLVSNPVAAVRLFVESYDNYELDLIAHCGHIFAKDFVYWCAGEGEGLPFAGTYHGLTGFQEFFNRFFAVVKRPKLRPLTPTFALAGNEVVARFEEIPVVNGAVAAPIWIVNISQFERGKIIRMDNYFDTQAGERSLPSETLDHP